MRARILLIVLLATAATARAQDESKLGADFRGEGERFRQNCGVFNLPSIEGCAELLFTDHPVHIAVGSIAPENGFGAGVAFVTHYTPNEKWRLSWNTDAVGSINGSWRAGVYMTAILTTPRTEKTTHGRPDPKHKPKPPSFERPEFHLYAQTITLNKIDYFGLGPSTTVADRSFYGMRQTIPGGNVWWPVFEPMRISLYGEFNGRFVDIRPSTGQPSPSIEQLYTEATAPGLTSQPGFLQLGEGVRLRPTISQVNLRFNYFVLYQQFAAPGNSQFNFQRFTIDLAQERPLYSSTRTFYPVAGNGPDDCTAAETPSSSGSPASLEDATKAKKERQDHPCPRVTRNREGSVGFRFFLSDSFKPDGHVVPFYLQPTLGGTDINGSPSLASYQDYRYRAPNVMLLRENFDHSIYGPLGFTFIADQGKVGLTRGDLGSNPWFHSFSTGLALRAGGFPQVFLLFSWGGKEGTHTSAITNASLLGGSSRPSLY
ncbi:MAG: hypothetical protein WBL63_14905 [Candidatus Acidiferrum sp.]